MNNYKESIASMAKMVDLLLPDIDKYLIKQGNNNPSRTSYFKFDNSENGALLRSVFWAYLVIDGGIHTSNMPSDVIINKKLIYFVKQFNLDKLKRLVMYPFLSEHI